MRSETAPRIQGKSREITQFCSLKIISFLVLKYATWGKPSAHKVRTRLPHSWLPRPAAHVPVSERGDEVKAAVHPVVDDVPPVQAALVMQVPFELLVNVGNDGLKTASTTNISYGTQKAPTSKTKAFSVPCLYAK